MAMRQRLLIGVLLVSYCLVLSHSVVRSEPVPFPNPTEEFVLVEEVDDDHAKARDARRARYAAKEERQQQKESYSSGGSNGNDDERKYDDFGREREEEEPKKEEEKPKKDKPKSGSRRARDGRPYYYRPVTTKDGVSAAVAKLKEQVNSFHVGAYATLIDKAKRAARRREQDLQQASPGGALPPHADAAKEISRQKNLSIIDAAESDLKAVKAQLTEMTSLEKWQRGLHEPLMTSFLAVCPLALKGLNDQAAQADQAVEQLRAGGIDAAMGSKSERERRQQLQKHAKALRRSVGEVEALFQDVTGRLRRRALASAQLIDQMFQLHHAVRQQASAAGDGGGSLLVGWLGLIAGELAFAAIAIVVPFQAFNLVFIGGGKAVGWWLGDGRKKAGAGGGRRLGTGGDSKPIKPTRLVSRAVERYIWVAISATTVSLAFGSGAFDKTTVPFIANQAANVESLRFTFNYLLTTAQRVLCAALVVLLTTLQGWLAA